MSLESGTIRGVKTWYGEQDLSQSENLKVRTAGTIREASVTITGTDQSASFVLPKGAAIVDSYIEVVEAFNMTGTTIAVGTSTSETTNSIVDMLEANAEAIGTYAGVPAGTLAAGVPLAADTTIAVAGTFAASIGKCYVHFRYSLDRR
jgi:hypothetical protein